MSSSPQKPANIDGDVVCEIFGYWQKAMSSPRSILDDKRRRTIRAALAMGYSARQLCQAIRGCTRTPFNMGINEKGTKYNGIALILRNADQIDRFIEADEHPPHPHLNAYDERRQQDKNFVSKLTGRDERNSVQADPNVIDLDMTEVVHESRDTGPLD